MFMANVSNLEAGACHMPSSGPNMLTMTTLGAMTSHLLPIGFAARLAYGFHGKAVVVESRERLHSKVLELVEILILRNVK